MPKDSLRQSKREESLSLRKQELRQALAQQEALYRLSQMPEWQIHLKPLLNLQLTNKWLDPLAYKTKEEFFDAYTHMHARAVAYQEVVDIVDRSAQKIEDIKKQIVLPEKPYGIG